MTIKNNIYMIQVLENNFKIYSQEDYDNIIFNVDILAIVCPNCNHSGNMVHHGSYKRFVQVDIDFKLKVRVLRVKCKFCGKTHALMPSSIVPYSKFNLKDIINALHMLKNGHTLKQTLDAFPIFDLSTFKTIFYRFKMFWEQKLISLKIHLSLTTYFITSCFANYFSQFMQVAKIKNILYVKST